MAMGLHGDSASQSDSAVSEVGGHGWLPIIPTNSFIDPRTCRLAVLPMETSSMAAASRSIAAVQRSVYVRGGHHAASPVLHT